MKSLNKTLVTVSLLLFVLSNPVGWIRGASAVRAQEQAPPPVVAQHTAQEHIDQGHAEHPDRDWTLIKDGCGFAESVEVLSGMAAFGFSLVPGFQPVAVVYGAAAGGAKFYRWVNDCPK